MNASESPAARVRCCGNCLVGTHTVTNSTVWRTDFLRLERLRCACARCDCTKYFQARVIGPRYDQRHYARLVRPRRRVTHRRAA